MRKERGALALFVDEPDPGRTLPLLIPRLGADAAAQLYEAILDDLVLRLCDGPFDVVLYAAGDPNVFRARYPDAEVRLQRGRGEGRRLHACFEELLVTHTLAAVARPAFPDLHPRMVQAAFEMMDRRDVVFGRTERGGWYFLGMREPRDVFRSIRWGMPGVDAKLSDNFARAHLHCGYLPARRELRTPVDLAALAGRLPREAAPCTHTALETLGFVPSGARAG